MKNKMFGAKGVCILFVLSFCLIGIVNAEEIAKTVDLPVDEGTWNLPSWLTFILSFEFLWKSLVAAAGSLMNWLIFKNISKITQTEEEREALRVLEAAVLKVHEDYVLEIKKAATDGKLTKDERKKARDAALTEAMKLAKGPALNVLKNWSREFAEAQISKIVNKLKNKKADVVSTLG